MTVTMTSPAVGKVPGETYTGPLESWLKLNGYAKLTGDTTDYSKTTGATPANDPTLAANREGPGEATSTDGVLTGVDFDAGAVDDDAPAAGFTVTPATGAAAGGTAVTLSGDDFGGVTGVTFGGTAATSVVVVDDNTVTCVTPAKTAGAYNVVVTDPVGSATKTNGFTYA